MKYMSAMTYSSWIQISVCTLQPIYLQAYRKMTFNIHYPRQAAPMRVNEYGMAPSLTRRSLLLVVCRPTKILWPRHSWSSHTRQLIEMESHPPCTQKSVAYEALKCRWFMTRFRAYSFRNIRLIGMFGMRWVFKYGAGLGSNTWHNFRRCQNQYSYSDPDLHRIYSLYIIARG